MFVAQFVTVTAGASSSRVRFGPTVKLGASFTGFTVIVNEIVALVSSPPFAVRPLSFKKTVTVAEPFAFGVSVNVKVPSGAIAGKTEKSARSATLGTLTVKVKVWPASSVANGGGDPG